jgi:hypothetical protein
MPVDSNCSSILDRLVQIEQPPVSIPNKKKPLLGLFIRTLVLFDHLPIFGGSRKAMAKNRVDMARAKIKM